MVTKYGMSDNLGPVALEGAEGKTLFGRGVNEKEYSEQVGDLIDKEVSKIMKDAHQKAEKIITEHRPLLDIIAKRLIEKESIEREEFETILVANGVQPKRKEELA
jgi:cell division protease FtsH